jgi:hypothetical protein
MVRYCGLYPEDPVAVALRSQIIAISRAYGVISPFTSFSGGGGGTGGGGWHISSFQQTNDAGATLFKREQPELLSPVGRYATKQGRPNVHTAHRTPDL